MKVPVHKTPVGMVAVLVLAPCWVSCGTARAQKPREGEGVRGRDAALPALDPKVIEEATGTKATLTSDGVVRIGWSRDDVRVTVDGMAFPPPAGLGSWAAFQALEHGAMVMGDTVVFRDEVDAAIDAAFEHGLEITALHNHFFYDKPNVYFMHIGGNGKPAELAEGVKAVWDAIKEVRGKNARPAERFDGPIPQPGEGRIDPKLIGQVTGLDAGTRPGGVVKVSVGRDARMHGAEFGGSMGLTTWAAFSGTDELAAMDGDFAMRAEEVQPVLRALRSENIHIVALHNHMVGEKPAYYFVHFWATGPARKLAEGFRAVLDAQKESATGAENGASTKWTFDDPQAGLPREWTVEGTNQSGPAASWSIKAEADAPSKPNVLALTDPREGARRTFNLCWTDRVKFIDGIIEVKVKAGTGRIDQGGGPIWRVRDKDNYYIARWNPLEDNFRVYYVKDGRRVQLDTADVEADPAKWHVIRIHQKGDEIACSLDGEELLRIQDKTFPGPGGVGLWTKADAATEFDDLEVQGVPVDSE